MPSVLVTDSLNSEVGGQEPWPNDVILYQPYENEQILLPESANCLSVQAFLKMCNLPYTVVPRSNAEFMSPSGKVPFIKCGPYIVSDLDPIVSFVANKGKSLINDLSLAQKSDMRAFMSLVNTVLGNAENYITWCDSLTYSQITKPRYGYFYPFPLNHILCYTKRQSVIKKLGAYKWTVKSLDNVYEEVDRCCQALSDRLENNRYFFGDKPTELDALVFGHLFTIQTTRLLTSDLNAIVQKYPNLFSHTDSIEKGYFRPIP